MVQLAYSHRYEALYDTAIASVMASLPRDISSIIEIMFYDELSLRVLLPEWSDNMEVDWYPSRKFQPVEEVEQRLDTVFARRMES